MFPDSMLGEETARPVSRSDGTTDLYIAPDRFHDIFCQDVAAPQAALWDCYCPDLKRPSEALASPLRASDEQLDALPPALLIVDEADVLRDEGEAYASRLRPAGVAITTVRYNGITDDFTMLNPLSATRATRAAVAQAIATPRQALDTA